MPANHPLLQPRQLASDADAGATAVAALLRPPASEQLPGALRVVVAKAVGRLAQERPRMAGRVLPPLLALAKHSALQLQVQYCMTAALTARIESVFALAACPRIKRCQGRGGITITGA